MPTVEGNSKHLEEDGQNSSEPYYKKLKSDEHYSAECSENRFSTEDYCKTGTDELQQRLLAQLRGKKSKMKEHHYTCELTKERSERRKSDPTGLVKQNVTEEHERSSSTTASCKTDLIGYNINAVFIGPRQKGENFKEHCVQTGVERKCELSVALNSNTEDKEEGPRTKREIEDELNQFYEEIKELESDPNVTSNSESENSFLGTEKIESVGYLSTAANNYNDWKLKSRDVDKPDFYSENRQNHSCPKQYSDDRASGWQQWRPGYLENGQADAAHWNNSPPPFRPEWQPMQSFIVPQGPRLPRFNGPLYHQRPCAPPHALNNFCPPNLGQFGFHENAGNEKWNCAESFENRIYGFHGAGVGNCRIQSPETSYNDQPGINNSGFYEDREKAWTEPRRGNDPPAQQYHLENPYRDDHVRPHLKVLILMRGVPGSGKSTLAQEVLAQHANEGLVLSTDDYFYHNGYSFDGKLLGDAHEWNQNRARDAMNHGRSPIVIDNTNTQAWEMKPYVGMALERGYGVEFHEPHTWWKFDPVELEKRNKHNVPREKIIQMMERFERPISIDIVMNSVQPPHKSSIRPPLQQRQRWGKFIDSGITDNR
uniref:NEDD4 binding protein 2 like 2 n=1 Tax=Latimeria chalumnae TaxID=7897 RepID=H3ALK5_LATCH